jgi:hypothetical protein
MVACDVNVLEVPVEVRGGYAVETLPGGVGYYGDDRYTGADGAVVLRGRRRRPQGLGAGEALLEFERFDGDLPRQGALYAFPSEEDARAEFERLKGELFLRQWVRWASTNLVEAGVVPAEFRGAVLAGELEALAVAADFHEEQGRPDLALLARAAFHAVRGEVNVEVKLGKGSVAVLNPFEVTKRCKPRPTFGTARAAVVTVGKCLRVLNVRVLHEQEKGPDGKFRTVPRVTVDDKVFGVGDQAEYHSYNLTYYAPVKSITAKTVVLLSDAYGATGPTHRLTLARFVDKNHDFDLAKARERNANWSD